MLTVGERVKVMCRDAARSFFYPRNHSFGMGGPSREDDSP